MKKIVVNGTFDVIHPGHLALLNYARSLGDFLLVAIDTDQRVQQLKGPTRPINNQYERKLLLENLRAVDQVEFFDSPEQLISLVKGCTMVKGSDYRGRSIIGETHCCEVIYYNRLDDYSSTKKIQNIIDRG
jgi:D-beta-D-heptose 7-phosphate kinase/D-beta-D-heptose 1-phosphate adenosyltransferase